MTIEVKVPVLPESVEDATIATWHKKAGDSIRRDENLVDLETDKVVLEVPAPADGVVKEIRAAEGDTVLSDDLIAIIEEGAVAEAEAEAEESKDEPAPPPEEAPAPAAKAERADGPRLSPSARRVAEEEKVDPDAIEGTGRGGRVTKGDVLSFVRGGGSRQEERVKMNRLRSRIAERMKEAQNTAAILTTFQEVDLKAVMDLRRKHQEAFTAKHGIKLGLMSFFVKACCDALRKFPVVNASIEGDEIVYHNYQDIGIAVSTERGLMVPIIRNAENLSLAELETAIAGYADKARSGTIALEDLQGGTFSITNGGVFGSLVSTPLLNPPQSAILGMHTIKERPVVVDGEIAIRPMMYLALSYDHRIIDGKDSVRFLVAVRDALEDPARLLLGI
ncbi:MAG: 2-oxoglutarate dehydrogenase complex dihydrolipoyllysine-residue succinyltransferase [Xanthomonadales bacterium]|nr:2-oxoglutarate dehydrogenase complex dihydrolipoyllysine-residue succinyltransferase [Gammaproteobacteria bacterium]NNK31643.1 2-oxoglutarate dehydrogenase complex dihydrolipoyllysine-residue succinyltransferase [Xanthomonadales bacterium]NNK38831.1 2-oxoglutarate dehydrogenase complex dihydrolipoyllysine-residue succinyltransferase [Xanthomonadales bacterium]